LYGFSRWVGIAIGSEYFAERAVLSSECHPKRLSTA
jgi:hypothetical protein